MFSKYGVPILAAIGVFFGIFMVFYGRQKPPTPPIEFPPAVSPYKHAVSGAGIIEAASENISIGTSFNDIVTDVYVKAGDVVKEGTPLFKIDTRTFDADLEEAIKARDSAKVNFADQQQQFELYYSLKDKEAVSQNEYNQVFFAYEKAKQELEKREAAIDVAKSFIERSTVRAPIKGEVLQLNIRLGQNVELNPFSKQPLIIFGNVDQFHIRVDIDEADIWRVQKCAKATAFVRGNSSIAIPLNFVRIEPYVVPKTSLTGDNSERVDTRVLQVLFSFERDSYPVYVGQILDVYMQALPVDKRYDEDAFVS